MIYLIDEKKNRQLKYGWDEDHFEKYSDKVTLIRDFTALGNVWPNKLSEKPGNIIMIHNSFFKNLNLEEKELFKFKAQIRKKGNKLIIFGGSFNKTSVVNNELELPVATFYNNLELFINQKDYNLLVLAYGRNSEKEYWLEIRNRIENFLFAFGDDYNLSDNQIFEVQKLIDFDRRIVEVLDKTKNVGYIKSLLRT